MLTARRSNRHVWGKTKGAIRAKSVVRMTAAPATLVVMSAESSYASSTMMVAHGTAD
jgi:hypothetical protein